MTLKRATTFVIRIYRCYGLRRRDVSGLIEIVEQEREVTFGSLRCDLRGFLTFHLKE
jgi:hypothetical protein